MKKRIIALFVLLVLTLSACTPSTPGPGEDPGKNPGGKNPGGNIGSDDTSYGEDLGDLGAWDGLFDGTANNVEIKCISGTPGCYKVEGNTIVFTPVSAESVYSISGYTRNKTPSKPPKNMRVCLKTPNQARTKP